jgi:Uma2 family endonuclease
MMGLLSREEGVLMSTARKQRGVRPRRFSKAEYYRLGELGFFRSQRVELIEGRVLVLGPKGPPHCYTVSVLQEVLRNLFGPNHHVRPQFPLDLGPTTEPEPDLAVVAGTARQYLLAHPTTALLIVEVSDSTLAYDRRHKGGLYARAGVPDYWIVNLRARQVEVYRAPIPDPLSRYGHRYSSRTDLLPPASVSPLALPQVAIPVIDLLP